MDNNEKVKEQDTSMEVYTDNGHSTVQLSEHASIEDLRGQVQVIQEAMKSVMRDNEHYGVIPGTKKPTLLKPGAEKLSLLFRLAPKYDIDRYDLPDGHREYEVRCTLVHINTGTFIGEGVGSCSTMEKKYRYRNEGRSCPQCGKDTIIKGKKEYGGGWLCYKKKGGCGAKWNNGASEIEGQNTGQVDNPDIADVYNTVLKMAKKRSHVDAILTATAASDIFTQDVEDLGWDDKGAGDDNYQDKEPMLTDSPDNFDRVKRMLAKFPEKHPHKKKKLEDLTYKQGLAFHSFLKLFFNVQQGINQRAKQGDLTEEEVRQLRINLMKCQKKKDLQVVIEAIPEPKKTRVNLATKKQLAFINENFDYFAPSVKSEISPRLSGPGEPLTEDEATELVKTIRVEKGKEHEQEPL